jgi:glycosyltransferase involved in cell wall biosynthesis
MLLAGWSIASVRHCETLFPMRGFVSSAWSNAGQTDLDDPPCSTVVGPVPDIAAELGRADVVVVPVRFGSGTRVKILEAFAHKIPVVSTSLGAEGLGAVDGRHLLVAPSAQGLGTACARLLIEPDLRQQLVDAAFQHYLEVFDGRVVEVQIAAPARAAVAAGGMGAS